LVAEGAQTVSSEVVKERLGVSPQAAANLLRRLTDAGMLERIRPGSYVIRQFGVLGTSAAAESLPVAVAAALPETPHRIGYRSALDELELLVHSSRTIQVAVPRGVSLRSISGRPLRTVIEPSAAIGIGATRRGPSQISDLERALLDAAARPELVGGATTLVEALATSEGTADPERLMGYAARLRWGAALRRIGSLADRLAIRGLAQRLEPLKPPTADLDLDFSTSERSVWRDRKWWVRWSVELDELRAVVDR
jgi:predicted transcriptional regulator of viral defense system